MKICLQCRRELDESCFRQTASRSTGLRKSKTGTKTICRSCESINVQAHRVVGDAAAGRPVDPDKVQRLRRHYQLLIDVGYPPVTKAARTLMGLEPLDAGAQRVLLDAAGEMDKLADLYEHISKVRTRSYSSFDEADRVHRTLVDRLRAAGLYDEVNDLMDRWFEE